MLAWLSLKNMNLASLQKILPGREDMRTAVYYIACLIIMNSILCIHKIVVDADMPRNAMFATIFSAYCNLAMHASGILFGIVIARMVQAEKEEAARVESQKESLI
jgi:hypothetical protein